MARFKYQPLRPGGRSCRLLRLLRQGDDVDENLIRCELFESELPPPLEEDGGGYEALSYTWGGQAKPCEIMINREKMEVTKNAYLALRDLRFRDRDRILWIDILCIDQNNKTEQGEQVQQMGSIYRNAERVIIWLGEPAYDINEIMVHMKRLEKCDDRQWGAAWSEIENTISRDRRDLLVEGFTSLLQRDWFQRVWIIQEVANARDAEVVCGSNSISASVFSCMPTFLKITPDLQCQAVLDIMPGPHRDRDSNSSSSWWSPSSRPDLYTMLTKFRECKATDPRDNIYALLGISSDAFRKTQMLKINYEKDLEDVIFDTALFLLNLDNLDPPPRRFINWTLLELFSKLRELANEVLKCAITEDNETVITLLLERDDVDVNIRVGDDLSPLLWAASKGHEAVCQFLLEQKAPDIEIKSLSSVQTPLSYAVEKGHTAIVKLLLENNAKVETKSSNLWTPLSYAAERGREAIVKLLLANNANTERKDRASGRTPISYAAERGHETVFKLLLEDDADIRTQSSSGRTPLSYAAEGGHEAIAKLLLANDADTEIKDRASGRTPLSYAAERGHEAVIKLLLANNSRRETKCRAERTPLSYAAEMGHEAVVKLLLDENVNIETQCPSNNTPLLYAAKNGHEAVVKLLLEKNANIEARDLYPGGTPLSYAAAIGHGAIVKLLLEKNANINAQELFTHRTPLSYAAAKGHDVVVKLLLENDADIDNKSVTSETPLSYATWNEHETIIKLLQDHKANRESF